jgi:ABC-type phosphate transport system substrate-binding protein
MKKISIFVSFFILPLISALLFISCEDKNAEKSGWEAINSGTFTALCDESLYDFLQPVFHSYDSMHVDIKKTILKTDARRAMAELLAGNAKIIILGRDYLKDEESLMKKMKVTRVRYKFAEDALVFFTQKNFPTDTLTHQQLKNILQNKDSQLKQYYPKLEAEPNIVINRFTSSEYGNLIKLVIDSGSKISRRLIFSGGIDSVKQYVRNNKNAIGVGYLSYLIKDTSEFKMLSISFVNKKGKYIFPHVVHQANIVQRYYPFVVEHYVYLLEDRQNIVYWFARYLSIEAIVQRYFNDAGIVPAYAKIKLIEQE